MKILAIIEIFIAVLILGLCIYMTAINYNCPESAHDCPGLGVLAPIFLFPSALILSISGIWLFIHRTWWSQTILLSIPLWGWYLFWVVSFE